MPNKKATTKEKVAPQPLEEMEVDEKAVDPEGILGDKDPEDDDEAALDDEEIDPFGDKWEQ